MTIKPSDIDLRSSFPPLVGTLGKTEMEVGATILVRACQVLGDEWQSLALSAVQDVMREDIKSQTKPLYDLNRNPFTRPDFRGLYEAGYITVVGDMFALTESAISTLFEKHPKR